MSRLIYTLLLLTLLPTALGASTPEPRVIICTNSGLRITHEQYHNINQYFIKEVDIKGDTLWVTLKGPSQTLPDFSRLKESYRADMRVNGERCLYHKRELSETTPKTTQYNQSDSCVYITFEVSPPYQTDGMRTSLSLFCILDSMPQPGEQLAITPMPVGEETPIVEWNSHAGQLVCAQVTCLPRCDEILPANYRNESTEGKLVILSSTDVTGNMEITGVKTDKKGKLQGLNLKLDLDCVMRPDFLDGFEWPVRIRDANITLCQLEKAPLRPSLYRIDHAWPEHFVNEEIK